MRVEPNRQVAKRRTDPTAEASPDPRGLGEILMVEDSPTDAQLALRAFELAEFANPVTVVSSGEQGLDYLFGTGTFANRGSTRPHLILLDLNLPGMSGVDFLHRVKEDGRTRDIPVVVISLSDLGRDVTACVQLGAEAYLLKPVSFENFARIISSLKLRLTLVAPPGDGKSGGWILSGSCTVPSVWPAGGGPTSAADSRAPSTMQPLHNSP